MGKYQLLGIIRDSLAQIKVEANVANTAHLHAVYEALVLLRQELEKEDAKHKEEPADNQESKQ